MFASARITSTQEITAHWAYFGFGTATGSGLADFWLGNVAGGAGSQRDTGSQLSSPAKLRGNVFAAFVQDDWRVTPTLHPKSRAALRRPHSALRNEQPRGQLRALHGNDLHANGVDGTTKFGNQALYNNYLGYRRLAAPDRTFLGTSGSGRQDGDSRRIRHLVLHGRRRQQRRTHSEPALRLSPATGSRRRIGTLENGFGSTTAAACGGVINQACYNAASASASSIRTSDRR